MAKLLSPVGGGRRSAGGEAEARGTRGLGAVDKGFYERHLGERVGDDPEAEHCQYGPQLFGLLLGEAFLKDVTLGRQQ